MANSPMSVEQGILYLAQAHAVLTLTADLGVWLGALRGAGIACQAPAPAQGTGEKARPLASVLVELVDAPETGQPPRLRLTFGPPEQW